MGRRTQRREDGDEIAAKLVGGGSRERRRGGFLLVETGREVRNCAGQGREATNRFLYFVEGENGKQFVSDVNVPKKHGAEIVGDKTAVLENRSETETMDVLLLQGKPIGEPVASPGRS